MRPGSPAGIANQTDDIPPFDFLPAFYNHFLQVPVQRDDAIAVVDADKTAIAPIQRIFFLHINHDPVSRGIHLCAAWCSDIDTTVVSRSAQKRVAAFAEQV